MDLENKTIVQILPSLGTGGVERGVLEVGKALVQAGARSIVISRGGPLVEQLCREGSRHITLPVHTKNPLGLVINTARLCRLFQDIRCDVVHVRSRAPALSAHKACRRAGIPMITTFHGTYGLKGLLGLKKLYNRQMLRGECVVVPSAYIADHLTTHYGVDPSFIRVVTEGADTSVFDPSNVSLDRLEALGRRWHINGSPTMPQCMPWQEGRRGITFLLPGRLTAWKGQVEFLEAVAPHRGRDFLVFLVGDDQGRHGYREHLESRIHELGLQNKVLMTGNCTDMPAAFMMADVVVSASQKAEAFGRVIAEAGAMGRPVMATAHGGACEIIDPEVTGWLVDVPKATSPAGGQGEGEKRTYPAMADVVGELLFRASTDPDTLRRDLAAMGLAAQKRVRRYFSLDGFLQNSLRIYGEAITRFDKQGRKRF